MTPADLLRGAIDLHVHAAPSLWPRAAGAVALGRAADGAAMRGLVAKAHEGDTAALAATASEALRAEGRAARVWGGIVLNRFVGGLNPQAVEASLALGGRAVWMPTVHAANHLRHYGAAGYDEQASRASLRPAEPVPVLRDDGSLRPEAGAVLEVVAEGDAYLSNGHLDARETRVLFREARRLGIERLVLAHPTLAVSGFDLAFQREAAELGAVVEHCWLPCTPGWGGVDPGEVAASVRALGAERVCLSTDLGQADGPRPVPGLRAFVEALRGRGVADADLATMLRVTPARLLGLHRSGGEAQA